MGTKADFYAGRGPEAAWLGSISWDGMPVGIPTEILAATVEEEYREHVSVFLGKRGDAVTPDQGWPWKWDNSQGTNYTYAFDKGTVFASCYGSSWWVASLPEPEHTTLKRKAARLPDMTFARKREAGPGGQGILIVK